MSKVYLFVEINVKSGKIPEFLGPLQKHAAHMRTEDGLEVLDVFRDTQDANKLCVWEVWRDRASWDAHMENDASKAWRPVAAQYVDSETITIMDPI